VQIGGNQPVSRGRKRGVTSYIKITRENRARHMAKVEHLPGKHEALSSNIRTIGKPIDLQINSTKIF
jgi:hypothetical protein